MGLAMLASVAALFSFYFDTARSFVTVWNSSETFAHGYVILPVSLWLIWRRRVTFNSLPATPCWPAIGLLLVLGGGWLLARMGEVQVVMQYSFAAMIPAVTLAVLGRRIAKSLAFPLLFVLLAVPFGEVFVDPLVNFTADFTVRAVEMTGIPILRTGTHFELPTGRWSVIEGCSGVRYLISSITLGALYAYLTYRSTVRRTLFMVTAVVAPIIANGLRAFMIVMIGHFSKMELAVGIDHILYGWVFFGMVMFLMFWIGSFWREDTDKQPAWQSVDSRGQVPTRPARVSSMLAITAVVIASLAVWPLYASFADRAVFNPKAVHLQSGAIGAGWSPTVAFSNWVPRYAMATATYAAVFRKDQSSFGTSDVSESTATPVSISILYYRNQRDGKVLISSLNRLVDYEDVIHRLRDAGRNEQIAGRTLTLREATLQGPTGTFLVWHWYWVDGQHVANDYAGKLLQAKAKLLLQGDDGAAVFLSAPSTGDPETARTALRAFLNANLSAIDAALTATRGK
ncbi:MAG: exosortase A [Burkholderiaceae bacterium]